MPQLLVLDGNSMLHRAYHAGIGDAAGNPAWALRGLVGYLARAAAHLRPDALVVGFDCPVSSARRDDYPAYKAQRPDKPGDLVAQLAEAPGLLREAGITTVVPAGYEADDVLASCAAAARRQGWTSVLMTSDRDAFALIDEHTTVLRVRNGGYDEATLVDSSVLKVDYGVHAHQYREFAALRGDPSDNLPGVRRFGAATAAKLLAAFGTLDAAFAAAEQTLRTTVGDLAAGHLLAPGARDTVDRNLRLMRQRADLPVPDLAGTRLPLSFSVMKRALTARGINLGPSLWALTGGVEPVSHDPKTQEDPIAEVRPWVFRNGLTSRRDPTPGQLALF